MRDCIEVMAGALGALARGESQVPLRTMMRLPNQRDIFALMPAYVGSPPAVGAKIISVFPGNHGTQLDSHQGAVLLFDASNGLSRRSWTRRRSRRSVPRPCPR